MSSYVIEPMTLAHVPEVSAIERWSFTNPWPLEAFEQEVTKTETSYKIIVRHAEPGGTRVLGYCIYWLVSGEMHIQNLAVHPAHRGKGLARRLLREAMASAVRAGATLAQLEVRSSNEAAHRLYQSFGFRAAGRRAGYYSRPVEDAVLYTKDPLGSESPREIELSRNPT